jgi:hypothetical protein
MLASQTYSQYWAERLAPIEKPDNYYDKSSGKPLKRIPAQFVPDVLGFTDYLETTAKKTFKVFGHYTETGEITEKEIPYIHRWNPIYRKSILAKLYQLEEYVDYTASAVTMITLTIAHGNIDQEECLLMLVKFYTKLFDVLRHEYGAIDYFYILEPHKSGYAHMHIMYMKKLSDMEQVHIKKLWADKYGVGSYEHGIDFSEPRASTDGFFEGGSIGRIRGYIMKYISKGLVDESGVSKMPLNELLFNSLLKKHKIRLWNSSRNFSQVMSEKKDPKELDWECDRTELHYDGEFLKMVWERKERDYRDTAGGVNEETNSGDWGEGVSASELIRDIGDIDEPFFNLWERVQIMRGDWD